MRGAFAQQPSGFSSSFPLADYLIITSIKIVKSNEAQTAVQCSSKYLHVEQDVTKQAFYGTLCYLKFIKPLKAVCTGAVISRPPPSPPCGLILKRCPLTDVLGSFSDTVSGENAGRRVCYNYPLTSRKQRFVLAGTNLTQPHLLCKSKAKLLGRGGRE